MIAIGPSGTFQAPEEKPVTTYWESNGLYQALGDKLRELVPHEGACTNPRSKNQHLDRFRRASNCYYDLYNNGLCNRTAEFNRLYSTHAMQYRYRGRHIDRFDQRLYDLVEVAMNKYILLAAEEQGIKV